MMSQLPQDEAMPLILRAALTSDYAESLADELLERRGKGLHVNASSVERLDTACIEVLIAASNLWRKDGVHFSFADKSEPFQHAWSALGIDVFSIEHGVD